jgi:hypothetical protein
MANNFEKRQSPPGICRTVSVKQCIQLTSSVTLILEIKGSGAERKQDEAIEYKLIA